MTSNGASNVNLSNGSSSVSSSSISPPLQVSIDWEVKYNTLLSKSKQFATTAKGKREALEGELREIKGKTKTFIMEQRKRREEVSMEKVGGKDRVKNIFVHRVYWKY